VGYRGMPAELPCKEVKIDAECHVGREGDSLKTIDSTIAYRRATLAAHVLWVHSVVELNY